MTNNPGSSSNSRFKLVESDIHSLDVNPLNTSSSKMQYSFPKAGRQPPKNEQQGTAKYYDVPENKSQRSTSFGFGKKSELVNLKINNPSPNCYKLPSQFDRPKGIAMHVGREIVKCNSAFLEKPFQVPGPGCYNPQEIDTVHKSSLSGRTIDLSDRWIKSVPGPGTYQLPPAVGSRNLKNSNSKFESVSSTRFDRQKRKSGVEQRQRLFHFPGPAAYKVDSTNYLVDRFQKKGTSSSFSKSKRKGILDFESKVPGPGSYKMFSSFIH